MTHVSLIQPRHQPPLCHPLLLTLVSLNIASTVQVCQHNHHYHPHFSHCPGSGGCEAEAERPVAGGQLAEDARCAGHR